MEFFKKQYINPEQKVVEALINEFDGDQTKTLSFDEFC
jgi:Ca2+-binding EF-hand superfamily protein